MQDNANPIPNDRPALPLKGYRLLDYKTDPAIVGIAFDTEQGPFMFVANKEILAMLGAAFSQKASEMPSQNQG
ncbi:hypothetical protein [Tardiphaga sp.]|uniref:hypothetical protein n=1 Tax=Tardiphaga sp. TaxID=1926292 RepID=UPI0026343BD5|nr:hypothetical protein [Tardiphaga sp.]MDB5616647.1 hypothetical protein [Tardiphaga sp.]